MLFFGNNRHFHFWKENGVVIQKWKWRYLQLDGKGLFWDKAKTERSQNHRQPSLQIWFKKTQLLTRMNLVTVGQTWSLFRYFLTRNSFKEIKTYPAIPSPQDSRQNRHFVCETKDISSCTALFTWVYFIHMGLFHDFITWTYICTNLS